MTVVIFLSLVILFIFCFYDHKKIISFVAKVYQINLNLKNKKNSKKSITHQNQNNKINDKETKINQKKKYRKSKTIVFGNSQKTVDKIPNNKFNKRIKKYISTSIENIKSFPPKKNIISISKDLKSLFNKSNDVVDSSTTIKHLLNKDKNIGINNQHSNYNIININNINIGRKKGKNKIETPIKINKTNVKFSTRKQTFKINRLTKAKTYRINSLRNNKNNKKRYNNYEFNKDINFKNNSLNALNDYELNNLDYKTAIMIDKRTYMQYYWSLLKKKQLILFTFYPADDYNLVTAKISLFLLSFSLYFTINAFFFNDDTMHKIYMDNGAFKIENQIIQIIYSSFISTFTNMILKILSLSESTILELKKIKNTKMMIETSKRIRKCLKIKFMIFFILNFLLLSFFWYFISCFCAVYINTQIILIKDTIISFCISMLYPFGINLFPGFLRIPSLKAKKKDKEHLYKISLLVAII
jgi:hypothetical protein